MKTEELKAQGLNEDQIKWVMAEHGKVLNAEKAKTTNLQEQLNTATASLAKFDGMDADKINGQIKELQDKLTAQAADFAFQTALSDALRTAGAKNAKAVNGLLDLTALKSSKNQAADIAAAIEAIKQSDAYLFEAAAPAKEEPIDQVQVVSQTSGNKAKQLSGVEAAFYKRLGIQK